MKFSRFYLCFAVFMAGATAWADASALLTSSEALDRTRVEGKTALFDVHGLGSTSVSDFSMVQGPALNDFDGHLPVGAPGSGASIRHLLAVSWKIGDRMTLGPVFDVAQYLYRPSPGPFQWEDPSVRLTVANVLSRDFSFARLRSDVWFTARIPASRMSWGNHELGGVMASFIPRLHFKSPIYSISGMVSARATAIDATAFRLPLGLTVGVQQNVRLNRLWGLFAMTYVSANIGPEFLPVDPSTGLPLMHRRGDSPWGLMTGVSFRPIPSLMLSPRLNWPLAYPLKSATIGLNASVRLI